MLLFFPCPESFTRLGHFLNSEMTVTKFDKGISKAAPAAVHQATWSHPNIEPKHFMHSPSISEPVNRAELKQLFPMSALFTISVCSHHSCSTHLSLHRLLYWHNVGFFTSCRKAFLNPVMSVGAKSLPGTQLTTTGNPLGQVPLDFSSTAWPSLQLDKCASLPVQLTE